MSCGGGVGYGDYLVVGAGGGGCLGYGSVQCGCWGVE